MVINAALGQISQNRLNVEREVLSLSNALHWLRLGLAKISYPDTM